MYFQISCLKYDSRWDGKRKGSGFFRDMHDKNPKAMKKKNKNSVDSRKKNGTGGRPKKNESV